MRNNEKPAIDLISYLCWSRTCVWWLDLLILKVFSTLKIVWRPNLWLLWDPTIIMPPWLCWQWTQEVGRVLHPPSWSGVCFHLCCSSHPYCHLCCFSSKWSCQYQLSLCWLSPGGSFEEQEQAQEFFFWDCLFVSTGSCKIADNELVHS